MADYGHIFIYAAIFIIFGFAMTYQKLKFLKEDIKYLDKKIERLEEKLRSNKIY